MLDIDMYIVGKLSHFSRAFSCFINSSFSNDLITLWMISLHSWNPFVLENFFWFEILPVCRPPLQYVSFTFHMVQIIPWKIENVTLRNVDLIPRLFSDKNQSPFWSWARRPPPRPPVWTCSPAWRCPRQAGRPWPSWGEPQAWSCPIPRLWRGRRPWSSCRREGPGGRFRVGGCRSRRRICASVFWWW